MANRKLLSYEILARFGLESDPFNLEPNGFQAGVHESRGVVNLMKAMKLAAINQNMVALVGDIGSGKSTAINTFIDCCSADPNLVIWRPAAAQVGKLTAYSICSYIVERHSSKRPSTDHAWLYRQVAEILIELRSGASVALVIDEAHQFASAGTLASLKNLFEIRDPQAPLSRMLAIILTGQPALERSLTAVTTLREERTPSSCPCPASRRRSRPTSSTASARWAATPTACSPRAR
ncbi:MAG: ATP-binding protein [Chromatiales bacterium]|nr:ATP-binding protein [Chromatiales bacterium]